MPYSHSFPGHRLAGRLFSFAGVAIVTTVISASACDLGGEEGDRCNSLIVTDECNDGLRCTVASCSESYCCPTNGVSNDPNCHAAGCPAADAGDDDGSEDESTDGGLDAAAAGDAAD